MSVITFVNNIPEETGKTMSLVAIATHMAVNFNNKILIVSTTNKKDKVRGCFFEEKQMKKMKLGIFGENKENIEQQSGIEGIVKMARSNKLTPEMITNYTKIVFKDRLELLLGPETRQTRVYDAARESEIEKEYIEVINVASMYYDKVFVDLDYNLSENTRNEIIKNSDLVIVNTNQSLSSIKELKENKQKSELLQSPKTLILVGKYDKDSKYNSKNITRFLKEKNQVLTIPYNTLYFEATNEANVPNLFLKLKRFFNADERNAFFAKELQRATENINYRLEELQTMI